MLKLKCVFSAKTCFEAMENMNYVRDECWINTVVDFYCDNLMSNKKKKTYHKRNHTTRC